MTRSATKAVIPGRQLRRILENIPEDQARNIRKRIIRGMLAELKAHLEESNGKEFKPFPVVSAVEDACTPALVSQIAELEGVTKDMAIRLIAERFVDDCHLDTGNLILWR